MSLIALTIPILFTNSYIFQFKYKHCLLVIQVNIFIISKHAYITLTLFFLLLKTNLKSYPNIKQVYLLISPIKSFSTITN